MNGVPIELTTEECLDQLSAGTVGRVAFSTPGGLRMVPVNYAVFEGAIVVRTSSYSELGTYAAGTAVAFEIDELDVERRTGWSVVANGRLERINDPEEIQRVRLAWDPEPWAAGARNLYLRLGWRELTGRRLGGSWLRASRVGNGAV
ncbi:MAG TPA: pyridoxamine 5'-phosphate oxidase family protein [Marmoricola sp.]|nr:pyridoxamine 5'-phosphate oxidase family protein [Marmoricola sp.]